MKTEKQTMWQLVMASKDIVSSTPEQLFKNGMDYFAWSDNNPIETKKRIMNGKQAGESTVIEHPRPYTVKAMCLFCNVTEEYLIDCRNTRDKTNEYYVVATKLMYLIYAQNMEMAMLDIFNPIFTAKVLNIEKGEEAPSSGVKVQIVNGLPELLDSEILVLEKLQQENPGFFSGD